MKYICLGYIDETKWDAVPESDQNALMDECFAYDDELRKNGHFVGGEALQSARNATTLRWHNGKVNITDGPYAETKEQLGGILILEATDLNHPVSKKALWAGRIISALPALFLLVDGVMKLVKPEVVVKTTVRLGYPESTILGMGIVLLVCVILYLILRASVLGAILLTGYLGGAVATHVRVGDPRESVVTDESG